MVLFCFFWQFNLQPTQDEQLQSLPTAQVFNSVIVKQELLLEPLNWKRL